MTASKEEAAAGKGETLTTAALTLESLEPLRAFDRLPGCYVFQNCQEPGSPPRFLYVSAGVERLHGIPPADVLADPTVLDRQVDPVQLAALEAAKIASCETLTDLEFEVRIRRTDGQVRWLRLRAHPERTPAGGIRWDGIVIDITGHKEVEDELRRTSQWLFASQRISATGGWSVNLETGAMWVSPEARRIYGAPDTGIAITLAMVRGFRLPQYHEALDRAMHELVTQGKPYDVEFQIRRSNDGAIVDVRSMAEYHPEERLVIGVVQDITELKHALAALRITQYSMEHSGDAIFWLTPDSAIVRVNAAAQRLLGYSHEDLLTRGAADLGPSMPPGAFWQELRRQGTIKYNAYPRTGDGRRVPVEVTANYISFENQEFNCSFARDITERERTEAQLREQASLLDLAHDGIVVCDRYGRVRYWNKGSERMLGWTAAEVIDRQAIEWLRIDRSVANAAQRVLFRGGEWSGEVEAVARDERRVTLLSRWTLLRDARGRPKSVLVINSDVTEKKELEAQFLRAQRLEAIGTLSSGVAHDLNNILSPMLMSIGMLREQLREPADRDLMNVIEGSARRGAGIIGQLLTFSRGIAGQRAPVQFRHLVKEMAALARETFPRNISVIDDASGELWPIVADATQLHQVLMNLCVNARDAMPDGGRLTIAADNVQFNESVPTDAGLLHPGPYVLLTVADTGEGIPREVLDRIFEPFFTTKPLGKGTGLGLSTVLGIVRSHGGFVRVESAPGRGSIFRVYFPAVPAAQPDLLGDGGQRPPRGHGELILLVDDESSILTAARLCLERHGYRVIAASDGAEALRLWSLHRGEVKLAVTDIMMPVLDGLKLARALRRLDPRVRVIATSGLAPADKPSESVLAAVAEFLGKPYDTLALLTAVRRQLDAARAPESPAPGYPTAAHPLASKR